MISLSKIPYALSSLDSGTNLTDIVSFRTIREYIEQWEGESPDDVPQYLFDAQVTRENPELGDVHRLL